MGLTALLTGLLMSYASVEDGTRVELDPYSDNWARLQALLDAHTSIFVSDGVFPISKCLNVKQGTTLQGKGVEATTFRIQGENGEPVVGLGGDGLWASSTGYGQADGVTLRGFTAFQTDDSNTVAKVIFNNWGDDFLVENVRIQGGFYEGITLGNNIRSAVIRNFEAWDCGNGGDADPSRSRSGINSGAIDCLIEDFVCRGCGQGVEIGGTRVVLRRGTIVEPSGAEPSIGVNIGSTTWGIYQVTVEDCLVRGYPASIGCGNGSGRLAAVTMHRNDVDGAMGFSGGALDNVVPHPDEGPTTEGSFILDNVIRVNGMQGEPLIYNTGPADLDGLYGREPVTIRGNKFLYDGTAQSAPMIGFAGEISAACIVEFNNSYGLDDSPLRGDVASFVNGSNFPIPGMPSLVVLGNVAYNQAGVSRRFIILRAA